MAFTDTVGRIQVVEDANRAALAAAQEQAERRLRAARSEAAEILTRARAAAEGAYTSELEYHRLSIDEERQRILVASQAAEQAGLAKAMGRRDATVAALVERFLETAPEA